MKVEKTEFADVVETKRYTYFHTHLNPRWTPKSKSEPLYRHYPGFECSRNCDGRKNANRD